MSPSSPQTNDISHAPVLIARQTAAYWDTGIAEGRELPAVEAERLARETPPLLCHLPSVRRRLDRENLAGLDLLELYALVRPAAFCTPTPRGLAEALALPKPVTLAEQATALRQAAGLLLRECAAAGDWQTLALLPALARSGWLWGPFLLALFRGQAEPAALPGAGLDIWRGLSEWSDPGNEDPPGSQPVDPQEARWRLSQLLGQNSEARPQQADYASALTAAFEPREVEGEPHIVLAEAGTGVGKTLGYIAPASLWSERNGAPVWISTYTRNLQRQVDGELRRLFPEPKERARRAVLRKGRENYLCLLNYEEAARSSGLLPQDNLAMALLARWAANTRDGDMVGGDFPGWLPDLIGRARAGRLTDRRGECIYAACPHYRKCFVERSVRRARHADLVIANHALVMIQAALGGDEGALPLRYVFDEAHHLFEAADSAFAAHLSGLETQELRRWLLGAETARSESRMRGLRRRLDDLALEDEELAEQLEAVLEAATGLPGEGWRQRLRDQPANAVEAFLALVRQQVYARGNRSGDPYSMECEVRPAVEQLLERGDALAVALKALREPMEAMARRLAKLLAEQSETLESDSRRRLDALARGLQRRASMQVQAWEAMLAGLHGALEESFVEWFGVERFDGREIDVGYYRHWVDPTQPFAETLLSQCHGAAITSATLTNRSSQGETDWDWAEARSGTRHLPVPATRLQVASPFDYGTQTRAFIVTDVRKDDLDAVAGALRALFLASGGGALGLFTAISRLRGVHQRLRAPLEQAGLDLLAQHVDGMDVGTLVDIFRSEVDSCLLGTDAVRDGVDVPGRSLRLIVFDRVPWPRPDLRHKARRAAFGGRDYDDRLTRQKLRQAFGRLIRRADDQGVFVLLDPMMPSRLLSAFPPETKVERLGLAEVVRAAGDFLSPSRSTPERSTG